MLSGCALAIGLAILIPVMVLIGRDETLACDLLANEMREDLGTLVAVTEWYHWRKETKERGFTDREKNCIETDPRLRPVKETTP